MIVLNHRRKEFSLSLISGVCTELRIVIVPLITSSHKIGAVTFGRSHEQRLMTMTRAAIPIIPSSGVNPMDLES
jgi:hypothetical protein